MKRMMLASLATFAMTGAGLATSAATAGAYNCAQFANPTVNQVWQTVCNAPDQIHPHP